MTVEQLLGFVYERLDGIEKTTSLTREALPAMAQAIRRMADTHTLTEKRQQLDDRALSQTLGAVTLLIAKFDVLLEQRSPSAMTAEEIAAVVDFDTLCKARRIVWARSHPEGGFDVANPGTVDKRGRVKGVVEPRPLPPVPHDIVPDHIKKKRAEDNDEHFKRVAAERRLRLVVYFALVLLIIISVLAIFVWRH